MVAKRSQRRDTTVEVKHIEKDGKCDNLRVMYTNIDGVLSSILELRDYLRLNKPDVVCITETKLKEEIHVQFQDEGYNMWRRDRKNKSGGGVAILTKANINVEEVEEGKGMAEVLSIVLKTRKEDRRRIIVTYVPPKTNAWDRNQHQTMQTEVRQCLDDMIRKNKKVLLMGDFNCREVNWEEMDVRENGSSWGEDLLQLVMANTMVQWIKMDTRFRGDEESQLDLVFTKRPEEEPSIICQSPMGKSDHVVMEVNLQNEKVEEWKEEHRNGRLNHAKANFTELKRFYGSFEWKKLLEGKQVQDKYEVFLNKYKEGVQKYVPRYKAKKGSQNWYNAKCVKAKKDKDAAWREMMRQRDRKSREEYQRARNEYVRVRREEERNFEKDIVEKCKDEPKLFYRYINGKLKHKDNINKLKSGGRIYETAKEMSEIMNKSFKSVFTAETDFVAPAEMEIMEGLDDIKVEKEEIKRLLEKLDGRKAMGPDEVSGWILRECKDQLVDPIWDIVKSSLQEGRVPREWKRANIVPIFKGGSKMEPLNYRPVSLTSVIGKLCEMIIKDRWVQYLEDKEIITDRQFGFRKGRSCITNLLSFYTRVIDTVDERDGWVDAVFLDLEKAFDKVPHKSLLWKLEWVGGLRGAVLNWMKDYLQGREMRTTIRDTSSNWELVGSGVPQGSVLAPIMFQVYINDMAEGLNSYVNLFADDAKLLKVIKSQEDCRELQKDIDKIHAWSLRWKLKFNVKKCHILEIGRSKKRPTWNYTMGDKVMEKRKEEKDLGVIIQDTLSPTRHIDEKYASTSRMLTNIRVAFRYMDKDMMKKILITMVRPKLEYAAVVWAPHKKKDIRKLERIQRAATKMVPELKDMEYEKRLEEMRLPTLQERRERGDLITMYKLVNGIEKVDREDLVTRVNSGEVRTRGHTTKLRKSVCLGDIKKFSFPHRTVDAWNSLNNDAVAAESIHKFKEKLDKGRYGDRTK